MPAPRRATARERRRGRPPRRAEEQLGSRRRGRPPRRAEEQLGSRFPAGSSPTTAAAAPSPCSRSRCAMRPSRMPARLRWREPWWRGQGMLSVAAATAAVAAAAAAGVQPPQAPQQGATCHHRGKVVARFCAKISTLNIEAYAAGDLGAALHRAFFRMDGMMRDQRVWRELQALGDKINQFTGIIEGLIWSPKGSDSNDRHDEWASDEGSHSDFIGPNCGH